MGFKSKIQVIKEKLDMYDMILANLIAGNSIIEPEEKLDNSKISIGFSNIASETMIYKYYTVYRFPDWLGPQLMDTIRSRCILDGVKIDFFIYGEPHRINWDSAEMKSKMAVWKQYAEKTPEKAGVFEYRAKRNDTLARERIVESTKYLNEAELEQKRTTLKAYFVVCLSAKRSDEAVLNLSRSIKSFKTLCSSYDIRMKELRINMIDWIQQVGVFSLRYTREVNSRISRKIMTDDVLANFNSYKQGRVGIDGVPLGIDVLSRVPVLNKFKADPDAADNWIISAGTGGGKSYFIKNLLTYILADGFVVTVMDYEGDEYYRLAKYVKAGDPQDVKIISMGKGSTVYFDPMEIAMLTGDPDVDDELKEEAVSYTLSIFRIISCGVGGRLDKSQEKVISTAIKRVYESAGVTDSKATWYRSKGLRISMVYDELKYMVESREFADDTTDNVKHKALVSLVENASTYFEKGEAKAGTFKNPMSANELFRAKLVIFSFGMKGATSSQIDPVILALKQLSVANVSIQISNYCKYVRKCFNVKVWEEYQRWGEAEGSAEIISNAMTGGRKRGDVNFLITNDLAAMLDNDIKVNKALVNNIQNYAIGAIKDSDVRHRFCVKFGLLELEPALDHIARASFTDGGVNVAGGSSSNKYKHSFCVILENGKRAIVKAMLPPELRNSKIFKTGVDIEDKEDEDKDNKVNLGKDNKVNLGKSK